MRVRVSLSTAHAHEVHTLGSPDTLARTSVCVENAVLRAAAASPAAETAALGQPRPLLPPTNSDQGTSPLGPTRRSLQTPGRLGSMAAVPQAPPEEQLALLDKKRGGNRSGDVGLSRQGGCPGRIASD